MRVYILSPYPAVRAGLAALLREQPGWAVVGSAAPQAIGKSFADAEPPDVLLADVDAPPDASHVEAWLAELRPRGGLVLLGPMGLPSRAPGRIPGRSDGSHDLIEVA